MNMFCCMTHICSSIHTQATAIAGAIHTVVVGSAAHLHIHMAVTHILLLTPTQPHTHTHSHTCVAHPTCETHRRSGVQMQHATATPLACTKTRQQTQLRPSLSRTVCCPYSNLHSHSPHVHGCCRPGCFGNPRHRHHSVLWCDCSPVGGRTRMP
jgi:hypothetical protein